MEQKLFNYYSIDECIDEDGLYQSLDKFVDNGSLEYSLMDRWVIRITDIDLTDNEILEVSKILDRCDAFPYLDYDDVDEVEEDDMDYDEYD